MLQEPILTPTSAPDNLLFSTGMNTPEYIYPRDAHLPHWLLSPPSGIDTLGTVDAAQQNVSKKLWTPRDFVLPLHLSTGEHQELSTTKQNRCNQTNNLIFNKCNFDIHRNGSFLKHFYHLSQQCSNITEFQEKLKTEFTPEFYCDVLSLLLYFSLSQNTIDIFHRYLLSKGSENSANHDTVKSRKFPIGVFWDIENCQVPSGKSAFAIVQKIRNQFFNDHVEAEFMAVCDINKESKRVIQDLNDAQVNVIHVNSVAKNTADDKLRQSMRRYAQTHCAPASIILITGDCNFTSEVSDLRHRHHYFILLMHLLNASKSLIQSSNAAICFEEFVEDIPVVYGLEDFRSEKYVTVSNLPSYSDIGAVRYRLKQLSSNCGGKILNISPPNAIIKFSSEEAANRALKRLSGEDVFGSKLSVHRKVKSVPSKHNHQPHPTSMCKPLNSIKSRKVETKRKSLISSHKNDHVNITISNIDSQIGILSIQDTIFELVSQHTQVSYLEIRPHNRFTVRCDVTVPNLTAASIILQKLHRIKIGSKRVLVTISQSKHQSLIKRNLKTSDRSCLLHFNPKLFNKSNIKINIGLREFSAKLHSLLHSHLGIVHLNGLEQCYEAQFGHFPYCEDSSGVYLEHLISYVPGVSIVHGDTKTVVWSQPFSDNGSDTSSEVSTASYRSKASNLVGFTKEIIALLKPHPNCCLPYNDFASAYEQEFQHPFSLNGSTDLLEILPVVAHVIQLLGEGSDCLVTLTHRAQVKRFTQELVKILKSLPTRKMLVSDLPVIYHRTFDVAFHLSNYGVSEMSDLLDDIPDGSICMSGETNILLTLPIRERTANEVIRTNQFSNEVVEILRIQPRCQMSFTDFVPAYHRHFGRQCKLANYGFTKLLDLFESLSSVVQIVDTISEKFVQLKEEEQRKVLASRLMGVLRKGDSGDSSEGVLLTRIPALYSRKYGFPLVPRHYGCCDVEELVRMLPHVLKIGKDSEGRLLVRQSERKPVRLLGAQLLVLLLDLQTDHTDSCLLHKAYQDRYNEEIIPSEFGFITLDEVIKKALAGIAEIQFESDIRTSTIRLKPIYHRAKRIRHILLQRGGAMTLGEFNHAYREKYHESLDAERYGFSSCEAMLRALTSVLVVRGFGIKKMLVLRNHMQYGPLSRSLPTSHEGSLNTNFSHPTTSKQINDQSLPPSMSLHGNGDSENAKIQKNESDLSHPRNFVYASEIEESYFRSVAAHEKSTSSSAPSSGTDSLLSIDDDICKFLPPTQPPQNGALSHSQFPVMFPSV